MWIEVFKSGKHTDSQGNSREYTQEDISNIAESYNSSVTTDKSNEAPIVKGHPKTDDPALGWVEQLKVTGNTLLAKIKDVVPEFAEEVKAGRFKKVSIALYPGNLLRHIGFLGAVAPAVKGLQPVAFEDKGEYVEYSSSSVANLKLSELDTLRNENSVLKQRLVSMENEKKDAEYSEFIDELIGNSKITPHQATSLKSILMKATESIEYSEGEPLAKMIMEFAGNMNSMIGLQTEFAQNEIPVEDGQFEGKNTAPERLALHNKAAIISRNNPNIPYEQALMLASDQ